MCLEKDEREALVSLKKKVEAQENVVFHFKSMASKAVINARSALNWNTKRTVLTQEVLRVLLNCSRLLPWERVVKNVNEMVLRMQYSGYSKKFRCDVVDSALKAYRTRKIADQEEERPFHRPKEWKKEEREQEKIGKKSSWYKRGGKVVPATPNSQLQKMYQTEIKRQGFRIKVVEKAGVAIKRLLQKSDPFKPRQCESIEIGGCKEHNFNSLSQTIKDSRNVNSFKRNVFKFLL